MGLFKPGWSSAWLVKEYGFKSCWNLLAKPLSKSVLFDCSGPDVHSLEIRN